jgi:hypothetical protein
MNRQSNEQQQRLLESGRRQLAQFKKLAAVREQDEAITTRLLARSAPDLEAIIDAARLLKRYQPSADPDDPATVLHNKLQRALAAWGMTEAQADDKAREAWSNGYRPRTGEVEVGSGAM